MDSTYGLPPGDDEYLVSTRSKPAGHSNRMKMKIHNSTFRENLIVPVTLSSQQIRRAKILHQKYCLSGDQLPAFFNKFRERGVMFSVNFDSVLKRLYDFLLTEPNYFEKDSEWLMVECLVEKFRPIPDGFEVWSNISDKIRICLKKGFMLDFETNTRFLKLADADAIVRAFIYKVATHSIRRSFFPLTSARKISCVVVYKAYTHSGNRYKKFAVSVEARPGKFCTYALPNAGLTACIDDYVVCRCMYANHTDCPGTIGVHINDLQNIPSLEGKEIKCILLCGDHFYDECFSDSFCLSRDINRQIDSELFFRNRDDYMLLIQYLVVSNNGKSQDDIVVGGGGKASGVKLRRRALSIG